MKSNPYEPSDEGLQSPAPLTSPGGPSAFSGCLTLFLLIAGGVGSLLGTMWIRTFGFTTYRQHLAIIGLPLGILTLFGSLGLLWFAMFRLRSKAITDRTDDA